MSLFALLKWKPFSNTNNNYHYCYYYIIVSYYYSYLELAGRLRKQVPAVTKKSPYNFY